MIKAGIIRNIKVKAPREQFKIETTEVHLLLTVEESKDGCVRFVPLKWPSEGLGGQTGFLKSQLTALQVRPCGLVLPDHKC
jgi:hypothetical protein